MNTFGYTVKTDHCPLLDCLSKVTQLTESSLLHGQHCNYSQAHSQTQQPSTAPAGAWGWSIQKLFQITGLHGHTSRRQSCAQNGYECTAMNGHEWPWTVWILLWLIMTIPKSSWLDSTGFLPFSCLSIEDASCKAAKLQSCKVNSRSELFCHHYSHSDRCTAKAKPWKLSGTILGSPAKRAKTLEHLRLFDMKTRVLGPGWPSTTSTKDPAEQLRPINNYTITVVSQFGFMDPQADGESTAHSAKVWN